MYKTISGPDMNCFKKPWENEQHFSEVWPESATWWSHRRVDDSKMLEKKGDQMKHKKHAKKQLECSLALGEIPASMIAPTYTHARLSDLQSTPEY